MNVKRLSCVMTDEEKELMNQIMQKMLRSLDEELQK